MTSVGGDGHGVRVVAEFQSGTANQVINHSEGKGPSKNRLMWSRVNQVQARLPAVSMFRWTAKYSKTGSATASRAINCGHAVHACPWIRGDINNRPHNVLSIPDHQLTPSKPSSNKITVRLIQLFRNVHFIR